jgi:signal transduction histidine kinase
VSGGILGVALFALATFLPRAVSAHCRTLSEAAVLEERRRIACDLHDGLGQELAYLARNLDLLAEEADTETIGRLRRAADRAQAESRRAVCALAAPPGQVFQTALAEAVGEVARRFHIELLLDTAPDVWLPGTRAEAWCGSPARRSPTRAAIAAPAGYASAYGATASTSGS